MRNKEFNLGDRIKAAIKQSGKSRKEIANEMEISEANIYKLYRSKDIKVLTLIKLAKVTDLPLNYFLNIEDSERIKELTQKLEEEKMSNNVLEGLIKNQHYYFLQLFDLIANMEEITDSKEKLTLMLPMDTKKIPLSRFFKLIYKFFTLVSNKSENEEEVFKLINILFNIVEFRQLILHPPDESFMLPKEIEAFYRETTPIFSKENEYIDFRELGK